MPRARRLTYQGGFYHIYNRGLNKQKIFISTGDYLKFLNKFGDLNRELDFIVYSYVLLPNHFHFLIEINKTPLAKIMSRLLTSYGVYFNKKNERRGPIFEDRYKSILVQKESYFLQLSRYIHLNPVKAKLVTDPVSYPYSSFAEIVGRKESKIVNEEKIERLIGKSEFSLKDYIEFVYAGVDLDLSDLNPWKGSREAFGSKAFVVNRIKKYS